MSSLICVTAIFPLRYADSKLMLIFSTTPIRQLEECYDIRSKDSVSRRVSLLQAVSAQIDDTYPCVEMIHTNTTTWGAMCVVKSSSPQAMPPLAK